MATGQVESVAVIPGTSEDEVWLAVLREIDGVETRFIERMVSRTFDEQEDCFFVDCGVSYDLGAATTTLTGLDHLDGEIVFILGDGAVYPAQTVAGGQVVLDTAVSKAAVGLPYRYTIKPMRLDLSGRQGASMGSYTKVSELVLSFLDTGGAQYGASPDKMYDIEWRTTEPYDSPPNLYTGDVVVTLDGGFDPETPMYVSGDAPLPCTLRAIVGRVEKTGR